MFLHEKPPLLTARGWKTVLAALCLGLLLSACASIPSQAPQLSSELGGRLRALEDAHLALVHHYMDERRARVSDFIDHQWIPQFADEFFQDPAMQGAWEEVVASGSAQDRTQYLLTVAPLLLKEIESKRREMLLPLDEVERELVRRLTDEYLQAKAINNALTSFLASASQVDQSRREYLAVAGVNETDLRSFVRDADEAVESLASRERQAKDAMASAKEYLAKMKELLDQLRTPPAPGGN